MEEKLFDFWLCNIPEIGCRKIQALLERFGSAREVFFGKEAHLEEISSLREKDRERLLAGRRVDLVEEAYEQMEKRGISFVCTREKEFPEKIRHLADAPYGLFYRGRLPLDSVPCVAVVGARDASYGGREIAKRFGRELAENGLQVISGMARGIDIAAQRGVLGVTRGRTYSVLGTGVDICYPRQHIEEYMLMQENGGVISEFPLKTPALPYHFPLRNRLISGFADGILVIEARKGSGSLITAELGLEQGKEIFVVPGSIADSKYEGSNALIQSGAALVSKTQDILDGLGLFFDCDVTERKKKSQVMLETSEKIVYAILSLEPIHLTQIAEETGLELPFVMEILMSLQLKNLVQTAGNNYFAIRL